MYILLEMVREYLGSADRPDDAGFRQDETVAAFQLLVPQLDDTISPTKYKGNELELPIVFIRGFNFNMHC